MSVFEWIDNWEVIWWSIFWSSTIMGELKFGIPYALYSGLDPWFAYVLCCSSNVLAYPMSLYFLDSMHKRLLKSQYYRVVINRLIERSRERAIPLIKKYGFMGVAIFIMIPLPMTGAYMATLAVWIVNMDRRQGLIAIVFGAFFAGGIIVLAIQGGVEIFEFMLPDKE